MRSGWEWEDPRHPPAVEDDGDVVALLAKMTVCPSQSDAEDQYRSD